MRHLLFPMLLSLLSLPCFAGGELTVFEVRKPIALSDKETVQKDYYINAGSESGLQKGMIITVIRKVPLYDSYQNRSAGDLSVPVAKVRIIQVQQGNSVARFVSEIARNEVPVLEENFIMVGDKLDLSTATHEKKTAQADEDSDSKAAAPGEPEKRAPSAGDVPTLPPPPTAQVTSKKMDDIPASPKDPGLGLTPTEGPTIR